MLGDKYKLVQLWTPASITQQQEQYINEEDNIMLYGDIDYNANPYAMIDAALVYQQQASSPFYLSQALEYHERFFSLQGAKAEVNNIRELGITHGYTAKILSGINANEESVKALSGPASPALLHIATHGFCYPDPPNKNVILVGSYSSDNFFKYAANPLFRSGLVFAGGNHARKEM